MAFEGNLPRLGFISHTMKKNNIKLFGDVITCWTMIRVCFSDSLPLSQISSNKSK